MNNNFVDITGKPVPIACGRTAEQWIGLLGGAKPLAAKKALNYFDGMQKDEVIALLNNTDYGRKNWKKEGMIPRFRNVTKAIVEKSGMLFRDGTPEFMIKQPNSDDFDQALSELFEQEVGKIKWQEFLINFDQVVRLLKTGLVLVQYDLSKQKLVLDILHRGNTGVVVDPSDRSIAGLIYLVSDDEETACYRIFTPDTIIDLQQLEKDKHKITVTGTQPNPTCIVPVATFYDTNSPRTGYWVEAPNDLVDFNELLNLHLTDSEYSMSWMKRPSLYTNMEMVEPDGQVGMEIGTMYGDKLPRLVPTTGSVMSGPGKVIMMSSNAVDGQVVLDYKGPMAVPIKEIDDVVTSWIQGYASDWSVKIITTQDARASSGFQLIVEQMDNLELRKSRQRMFEDGFKDFYEIFKIVVNNGTGKDLFPEVTSLEVEFPTPNLPVDDVKQEMMWSQKITEGRASPIDYYIATEGMTEEEACRKHLEVLKYQAMESYLVQLATQQAQAEVQSIAVELGLSVNTSITPAAGDALPGTAEVSDIGDAVSRAKDAMVKNNYGSIQNQDISALGEM